MELLYTSYLNPKAGGKQGAWADWLLEGHTLSAVSSQNILLFTTSTRLKTSDGSTGDTWGGHVYCVDLNTPWDVSLVCELASPATCLAWEQLSGTRFVVGDCGGQVQVWQLAGSLSSWHQVAAHTASGEAFLGATFLHRGRNIRINEELKDSSLYSEKFSSSSPVGLLPGSCVLVSASGLVLTCATPAPPQGQEPVFRATTLGLGRKRLQFIDLAFAKDGKLLIACCGAQSPVSVFSLSAFLSGEGDLVVRVRAHSSFSLELGRERIMALRFLLREDADALVMGLTGEEGGRLQLWQLEAGARQVHKLFQGQGGKAVPHWSFSDEFSCPGVAGLLALATPHFSVLGGRKPACYIAAAFSDGTVQCLLRDSLQQIESVELPRAGNIGTGGQASGQSRVSVTITSLHFTATANCLVVTDSLGQVYLYRMSPLSDPGGPPSPSFTVTMLEYCLLSGRDSWDLVLASKSSKLEGVCEKFSSLFGMQPAGVRQYYLSRFLSLRSSLLRLSPGCSYRAGDTLALLILTSIEGEFKALLRAGESSHAGETQEGVVLLEKVLAQQGQSEAEGQQQELETLLANSGLAREPGLSDPATLNSLSHLGLWVITLSLHLLAAVPEYKTARGPGYWLCMGEGEWMPSALPLLRQLLAVSKLWGLGREATRSIQQEKDTDLTSKLFSLVSKLARKQDDESLIDECLMLPHKVMIPPLDTLHSPRGVLGCLYSLNSPLRFSLGVEPQLPINTPPPFLEGLTYTEGNNVTFKYDCLQKVFLGEFPSSVKACTRCTAVTQPSSSPKSGFSRLWEKRWIRSCHCGGPWKVIQMT